MAKERAHVLIKGKVQGVYFRSYTCEKANELKVVGWVRNKPGGEVEAVFEGEKENVRAMVEWVHQGPPFSYVKGVEIEWQEPSGEFKNFFIKY